MGIKQVKFLAWLVFPNPAFLFKYTVILLNNVQ